MNEYPDIAIVKWCDYIGGDTNARTWLIENNFRELAEFWDAYEDVETSFQWLKSNGFVHLAACIDAMSENDSAKAWLMRYGYTDLAAFCDASEGKQSAVSILVSSGNHQLVTVAKKIFDTVSKRKKSMWSIFNFGNPFK